MSLPKFILVMAVSPRGTFRRCAIQFDRTWKPLQIGPAADLAAAIPMITAEMYRGIMAVAEPQRLKTRLKRGDEKEGEAAKGAVVDNLREAISPPMLAVREASEQEVDDFLEFAKVSPNDKDGHILELRTRNADLEARMMRLELGNQKAGDVAAAVADRDRELAELRKANADQAKQLAELTALVQAQLAATQVDGPKGKDAGKAK